MCILENNPRIKNKILQEPLFSESTKTGLLNSLLSKMRFIFSKVLTTKFTEFIAEEQGVEELLFFENKHISNHPLFTSFENKLKNGYWEYLLKKYPLFQECVENVIERTAINIEQCIKDLFLDASILQSHFGIRVAKKNALIKNLFLTEGCREYQLCSFIIEFDDHKKIVYKPTRAKTNTSWLALQKWLRAYSSPFVPLIPFTFEKESYAWQEFITKEQLKKKSDIKKFVFQNGCINALAFLLGAKDLHSLNIFPTSSGLSIIDGEAMFSPVIDRKYITKKDVMDCGILFTGAKIYLSNYQFIKRISDNDTHTWILNHRKEYIKGFKTMYHFFLKHKKKLMEDLTNPSGALKDFYTANVRFFINLMHNYSATLLNIRTELEHIENFEKEIEKISFCDASKIEEIQNFEKYHLRQFSIPTFYTDSNTTSISTIYR
ncbi:MAG: DUF4135 domain-containing protein [Chlamydiae bacterium]|nr:DUF4135 domain-containing protein [Chlamydiota bacterium]